MDDNRDPVVLIDGGTPSADRILDYVHGRYRRRKRIQNGSLYAAIAVALVVVTAVAASRHA